MTPTFLSGIIGSLILVAGAGWPETKANIHPTKSTKNWLLALGAAIMLIYAILSYLEGGPFFFIILEIMIIIAALLMMLDVPDKIDIPIITASSIALVIWSLYLFENYTTIIFIVGLCGVGLGYALQTGSFRRNFALTLGSALIALFSYLEASWIFFWLNLFFSIFSAYYTTKIYFQTSVKKHPSAKS